MSLSILKTLPLTRYEASNTISCPPGREEKTLYSLLSAFSQRLMLLCNITLWMRNYLREKFFFPFHSYNENSNFAASTVVNFKLTDEDAHILIFVHNDTEHTEYTKYTLQTIMKMMESRRIT